MFTCGHCADRGVPGKHTEAATVRACGEGRVESCHWMVERWPSWEDPDTGMIEFAEEASIVECGASAVIGEDGWYCEAGHEYTSIEARHRDGWEYAEDEEEARRLAAAGVDPVLV